MSAFFSHSMQFCKAFLLNIPDPYSIPVMMGDFRIVSAGLLLPKFTIKWKFYTHSELSVLYSFTSNIYDTTSLKKIIWWYKPLTCLILSLIGNVSLLNLKESWRTLVKQAPGTNLENVTCKLVSFILRDVSLLLKWPKFCECHGWNWVYYISWKLLMILFILL